MRRPRRLTPGARWFVTVRCARSEFRLTPTKERTELFKFYLATALRRCAGVDLHAVVQMSNHFHLVLTDRESELARLMEYLNGQLARELNYLDGTTGQVFECRYSAIEIVDDEALADRIVYAVTNPSAAGLVRSHTEWPGLVAWFGGTGTTLGTSRLRRALLRRATQLAVSCGDAIPNADDYRERDMLVLCGDDTLDAAAVETAIFEFETERSSENDDPPMGAAAVVRVRPTYRPTRVARSRAPLCHASTKSAWFDYREKWKVFVARFREASAAFRSGALRVDFPDFTFRPSLPVLS